MNNEIEIVHIGELDDIDVGSVENFEYDEKDYAIFHLKMVFLQYKDIVTVRRRLS